MKTRLQVIPIFFFSILSLQPAQAQTDPWIISANSPDPSNYYGVTVANGMIGIVSSPQPFQVKDVA
jgi:hypothetical protein